LIATERRAVWVDGDCLGTVEIETSIEDLTASAAKCLGYRAEKASIGKVLDLFVRAKLAGKDKNEQFRIKYRRFRIQTGDMDSPESLEEQKLDHVKEGIIRALTRSEQAPALRVPLGRRRQRFDADKNQLNLF